ncbi:MAG: PilZ domain-containing protein [Sorangiineae bacterium]|nr:PilZ domain-containing protein [Polyangiaceae bacterium]MEB2321122.1 PilZ domain-containing protein [Sorangiineae bacterium]
MIDIPGSPSFRATRRTAKLTCQVVRLRDFRLVADTIEDLSPAGLRVGPADPVLTGEPLIVSFRLPGLGDWIDADAVVRRVIHGRRPGESERCLGLELTYLDAYSARLVAVYARRLPPAPPRYRLTLDALERWSRRLAKLGHTPLPAPA